MLKLIDKKSELDILQFLNDIKPPCPHIIPLLDVITSAHHEIIISVPRGLPLKACDFKESATVVNLMTQLISAVGFIHANAVAHLDLKPSNIVIFTEGGTLILRLIDFSVSVRGRLEVKGFIGTPGWVAPEVGLEDDPPRCFNPTLADLWACGKVIRHTLAEYSVQNFELLNMATALTDANPLKRPSLHLSSTATKRASAIRG
jgi:serine/threonine protein kinase